MRDILCRWLEVYILVLTFCINVGNSYSKYIINDLLREKYSYNGVVCTDWAITKDNLEMDAFI